MSDSNGAIPFDWAIWAGRYPELVTAGVSEAQASDSWTIAGLYLQNCAGSLVWQLGVRGTVLGMITAHLLALTVRAAKAGDATGGAVGRLASATEGSVTATWEAALPESATWWAQTQYGFNAWQALAPFRTALYVAAPQVPVYALSYPGFLAPVWFGGRGGWPR